MNNLSWPLKVLTFLATLSVMSSASAGWQDWLKVLTESPEVQEAAVGALDNSEIADGLREALANGTHAAVTRLGQDGGFWNDERVRVNKPDVLQKSEKLLRQFGAGAQVDEFHHTLNKAAEKAVPQAADVFSGAVRQLSIQDASSILNGGDNAATSFFERTTRNELYSRLAPIVAQTTEQAGLTRYWQSLVQQAGPLAALLGDDALNLNDFVTNQALDGLFVAVADEEAKIRENPQARTTDLLKKVFQ